MPVNMQTRRQEESGLYLYYVYCFFLAGDPLALKETGIDEENPVFSLSHRSVSALVSRVPFPEYNETILQENLANFAWLTPRVKRHEQIIKAIATFTPILPVRFGTIYKSRARVLRVIQNHHDEFYTFLHFVQDKEEWGVKIYINEQAEERLVCRQNPALLALDKRIRSASTGERYFLKKKREQLLRDVVENMLNTLTVGIYTKLCSWSVAAQQNRLLNSKATGKTEEMVLNAAFLIEKEKTEQFVQHLDRIAAPYKNHGLVFTVSGPWPPYNFCPQLK